MTSPSQALPEAPVGAVEYTPEQLAEMQAIPSRPILEDGTKNPFYNQRMDPGSDRWDAHTYFKNQPQVDVFVHKDPEAPDIEVFGMSINGFQLPCYPGHTNRMPQDFVELLKNRNYKVDFAERRLISTGDDTLTMSVNGSNPRSVEHRVAG